LLVVSDVKWSVHGSRVHAVSTSHCAEPWKLEFGRGRFLRQSAAGMNRDFSFSPIRSVHGQFESDLVAGYGMAVSFPSRFCRVQRTQYPAASMAASED
jgi:hypothetical protein